MNAMSYNRWLSEIIELGVSDDVAVKALNKIWGYNVKEIVPWSSTGRDFTIYVEFKNGNSMDVVFNLNGGIIRRKLVNKGQ